jgi:hypothetical protein
MSIPLQPTAALPLLLVAVTFGCATTQVAPTEARAPSPDPAAATSCDPTRDRAAIRAMAGSYDVDFDFRETQALTPGYELHGRHRSAATELVILVEDKPQRLSLQHVLVVGGGVIKHWRQDWAFEDRTLLELRGRGTWARRTLSAEEARCTWSQAVFGVDDSPRYEGYGRFRHSDSEAVWESNETWRPLPRREYSTRSDYDVLVGVNRHRITKAGWEHEQDNVKLVLEPRRTLARERGLNSYLRTQPSATLPATAYWQSTAPFWAEVRAQWDHLLAPLASVTLQLEDGKRNLHEPLFERATASASPPDASTSAFIRATIASYVVVAPPVATPQPTAPLSSTAP